MVSAVPVVSVVSFRWFRFGVSGFSTCLQGWTHANGSNVVFAFGINHKLIDN